MGWRWGHKQVLDVVSLLSFSHERKDPSREEKILDNSNMENIENPPTESLKQLVKIIWKNEGISTKSLVPFCIIAWSVLHQTGIYFLSPIHLIFALHIKYNLSIMFPPILEILNNPHICYWHTVLFSNCDPEERSALFPCIIKGFSFKIKEIKSCSSRSCYIFQRTRPFLKASVLSWGHSQSWGQCPEATT